MITSEQVQMIMEQADCLYNEAAVNQALDRMAIEITEKLADQNPHVLCVLSGAIIPAGHLLTRLQFPLTIDYIHATRYRGETSGGELHWLAKPKASLAGRAILVIDDILDEGLTLKAILDYCRSEVAASVYSAVLVDKKHNRKNGLLADFVGVETEDRYLFGFGMDYKGYLRNAAGIYAVKGM